MADSDQPKKAPSAYWLYLEANRAEIVKALGTAKPPEVSKKAGEQWKALSAEARKPFDDQAAQRKAEYATALEAFKAGGGVVVRKSKKEKLAKKAKKDPNAPKRPAGGGYGVYVNENREEIKKGLPADHKITDVSRVAGARWKALGAAERKVYEDKYAAKKEEYKNALAEYKPAENEAEDAKVASPPAKAATRKRGMDKSSEKKDPKAKRGRPSGKPSKTSAQKDSPAFEEAVLEEAKKLGYEGALKNLASRSEIAALNLPGNKILSALQKSNGLVNAAKHALLGA